MTSLVHARLERTGGRAAERLGRCWYLQDVPGPHQDDGDVECFRLDRGSWYGPTLAQRLTGTDKVHKQPQKRKGSHVGKDKLNVLAAALGRFEG